MKKLAVTCLNCLTEFHIKHKEDGFIQVVFKPTPGMDDRVSEVAGLLDVKCPKNGCDIDDEMLEHPTRVVAFVGESSSSKTHLMVSMIHSIMNDPIQTTKWSIVPSRESIAPWITMKQLLTTRPHTAIPATIVRAPIEDESGERLASGSNEHRWAWLEPRTPIVLKVTSARTRRTVNLAFMDVAGEDCVDVRATVSVSPHLAVADFLVFVIPPTLNNRYLELMRERADDTVRDSLADGYEHAQTIERTNLMIEQVAQLWRHVNRYPKDLPIERDGFHTMTVLAKSDLLSLVDLPDVRVVAPPRDWAGAEHDPFGGNNYDYGGINQRDAATRHIVQQLFPAVDTTLQVHFRYNRYFPVSATGCAKNTDETFPVYKPYAAVDPLLHMLNQIPEFQDAR